MKPLCFIISLLIICSCTHSQPVSYTGSTPADTEVRDFLGISMTDSIDFIRWKLVINGSNYELDCHYGLSKPNTNGFSDEQSVRIKSSLLKTNSFLQLQYNDKTLYLLLVNVNLLHIANKNKNLLAGNGGYSYALNNLQPVKSAAFNFPFATAAPQPMMAYQGRTPCPGLVQHRKGGESPTCYKLKWYLLLFTDSITGQPTHYLQGGMGYRKETMHRGSWAIEKGAKGETIYVLDPEKGTAAARLLKAADNILFFTDPEGNLLVGNGDFSYTLNRTVDREPGK